MRSKNSKALKSILPVLAILLLIGIWMALKIFDFDEEKAGDTEACGTLSDAGETCLQCHEAVKGFSKYHDPELIGCTVCHLGDPESADKESAHDNMVVVPGNLSDAENTCGSCHPNELEKIQHSLMTSNSGLVAVDKYIFGETNNPDHHFDIRELGHGQADDHLRNLCANCHLGAPKDSLGPVTQLSRGGGCNACHLNYSEAAENQLQAYLSSNKERLPVMHPSLDVQITDQHCFGCHSRSSRISTNYMGWHETLLDEEELIDTVEYKVFEDKRVYRYQGEDVHHSKGLLCIDCHSSHEVMGDGKDHSHEEEAVTLNCADCHSEKEPLTVSYEELDTESRLVFMHRDYTHFDKRMLAVQDDGHPLVNTFLDSAGQAYLLGKGDGKKHVIRKQGDACSRDQAHQSLNCSSCHSVWAPRCIGCHNTYDDAKQGYDLLDKKLIKGTWIEQVYEFEAGLPAMGVRIKEDGKEIEPAIPGMILTIDHKSHGEPVAKEMSFERLYAPIAPHTTSGEVRTCASCHTNPAAIGYGKGKLEYRLNASSGKWLFKPEYASNEFDGLPEDAWIPFLKKTNSKKLSTRSDFRPLNIEEQQLILTVGACLQCHDEGSGVMKASLKTGLNQLLLTRTEQCLLPEF